jgi:DNA-binding NarL/FixJ family response regulator
MNHIANNGGKPIRVVLVDDHQLVREGLRVCLDAAAHIEVVGEAASGEEALQVAAGVRPDLMLVDIGMRGMTGIRLAAIVRDTHPGIAVLMLSMYDNNEYVANARHAGARGYVLKESPIGEIITAIEVVAAGGSYYSASVAPALEQPHTPTPELTGREYQVLLLVAHGHNNKTVAQELDISVRTVESHRFALRRKVGVDTAAGLLKYALERGLTRV